MLIVTEAKDTKNSIVNRNLQNTPAWNSYYFELFPSVPSPFHLVVRTLHCGRSNPGSNPGRGIILLLLLFLLSLKVLILFLLYNAGEQQITKENDNKRCQLSEKHISSKISCLKVNLLFITRLRTARFPC